MALRAFGLRSFALAAFAVNALAGDPTPPAPGGEVLLAYQTRAFSRLKSFQVKALSGLERETQTLLVPSASASLSATSVVLRAANGPPMTVDSAGASMSGSNVRARRANWPTVNTVLIVRPAIAPRSPGQRAYIDALIVRVADE